LRSVFSDPLALGFFGLGYYTSNRDRLGLVPIDDGRADNGEGAIVPNATTVALGSYQPLTRPIFVYLAARATEQAEAVAFLDFYLERAPALIGEIGYVPLSTGAYELVRGRLAQRSTGSIYERGRPDAALEELLLASAQR
jgi:phosphate transport system substrate-binding protein